MRTTRVLKTLVGLSLAVVMGCSMFGCGGDDPVATEAPLFANQYATNRLYFQQGYPDDWTYTAGEDGAAIRRLSTVGAMEGYYAAKFFPTSTQGNGMNYQVYRYNTQAMLNTLNSLWANLTNPDSTYFINDVFYEEEDSPRQTFNVSTAETDAPTINRIQYKYADYTFVKEGVNWRGRFYVTTSLATWFTLILFEAPESEWDTALPTFMELIGDHRHVGLEDSDR